MAWDPESLHHPVEDQGVPDIGSVALKQEDQILQLIPPVPYP